MRTDAVLQLLYLTSQGSDVLTMEVKPGIRQPVSVVPPVGGLSQIDRDTLEALRSSRSRPDRLPERLMRTAEALGHSRGDVSRDTCRRLLEAFFESQLTEGAPQCEEDPKLRQALHNVLDFTRGFLTTSDRGHMVRLARQAGFEDCAQLITAPAH